jgi:uncharacterized protein YhdP
LLRFLLRPLLVLLTLGALVMALLQVGGRVVFTLLSDLEVGVNQLLAGQNLHVTGLSGDWRMLNPIVRAERVRLPAGELRGLVVEVDMLSSLWHGRPLARRLKAASLDVTMVKAVGEPWRLAGGQVAEPPDLWPLLRHSEQLELDGVVRFDRHGHQPAALQVSYLGINRGGSHRHRVILENEAGTCADVCRLVADLQARDGVWLVRPGDLAVSVDARGFTVPQSLIGMSPLRLARVNLAWQRSEGGSGGRLALQAEQFAMPGQVSLATSLSGVVRGRDGLQRGALSEWRVQRADEVWQLPDVALRIDAAGATAWMAELDLGRANRFVAEALAGVDPAERWLKALDIRGRARDVHARVEFAEPRVAYAMRLDELAVNAFKGVPEVRGAAGALLGSGRSLQLDLAAQDLSVAFPDVFADGWHMPYAQGELQAWFGRDYFGIRGSNLRAETLDTQARGSFALSRPVDRRGQRLLLRVETDQIDVATAQRFVPYKLPEALRQWLETAPSAGRLRSARLALQGQLQLDPGELGRRLELAAEVRDGRLRYHPEWPEVSALSGRLTVAGAEVSMEVDRAESAGAELSDSRIRLLDNGRSAEVDLDAAADMAALLAMVRTTPLQQWLGFVAPDWSGSGPVRVSGELLVPLRETAADALAVRLRADVENAALSLPGYRLAFSELNGSWRYRYPFELDANGVTGRLFDQSVVLGARSAGGRMHLLLQGRARPDDVWTLLDVTDPDFAAGEFDYRADVAIDSDPSKPVEIALDSDLADLALALPAGFGKRAGEAQPLEVQVAFFDAWQQVTFRHREAEGWLHVGERPLRGAIGFSAPPPVPPPDSGTDRPASPGDVLVLGGQLTGFRLDEVLPAGDGGGALPLPLRLDALQVGEVLVGDFPITDATLSGTVTGREFDLSVASAEVTGRFASTGTGPMQVVLREVRVPVASDPVVSGAATDPLTPSVIAELPTAEVTVERLLLGDQDYGRWQFRMRPERGTLYLDDLQAEVRGMVIVASEALIWDGVDQVTRFRGALRAGDLADVLPQWGYAPSVETERAELIADVTWPGSPAAFDLLTLNGSADARAESGRFVDVESGAGAQRIVSLLNFTTIAKRMSLNFSDVFGRGVSFDALRSRVSLDRGLLEFEEPLEVEGTGSRFRVTGSVDLAQRRLDNEMIVTLPVTRSLPWYAAYVALANPLAGIGVLVGERVLRKPLEQFSSARYRISGTLDDPLVTFVSVFDVTPADLPGDAAAAPAPDERPEEGPEEGPDEKQDPPQGQPEEHHE